VEEHCLYHCAQTLRYEFVDNTSALESKTSPSMTLLRRVDKKSSLVLEL